MFGIDPKAIDRLIAVVEKLEATIVRLIEVLEKRESKPL